MKKINIRNISGWLISSVGILFLFGVFLTLKWSYLPPKIPWFYSLPWGEDQLMMKEGMLILIAVSLVVVITTALFLPRWVKNEDTIVRNTVLISLFFLCLMLTINMLKVLLIFI